MCGICGIYNFGDKSPVDEKMIQRMTDSIAHRGPDDEGVYLENEVGLGFRRLSIIDLGGGHQPMADSEEKIWLTFNGEIYNFKQLRKELEGHGHVFKTTSDTETIIYGYKQWGIDVLQRLNGMFGLAIWDVEKKRLLIARDRAGIKLIYFRLKNNQLIWGSELRPILEALPQKPDINPTSLNLFLRYRYTPSPLTIYDGINKLAPGEFMLVENGAAKIQRYWNTKPEPFDPMPSPEKAAEELLELYKQAVDRQLVADVPLGLLLSGGLDSGLLLALMKRGNEERKTFSVGFGESYTDDELSDAQATAKVLGAPNFQTRIDQKTFEENLTKIINIVEEPIASPSVVPMYYVAERARQDVKVALMGQGPDELFGGYKRHLGVRYGNYWRAVPNIVRKPLTSALQTLPRRETLKRGLYSLGIDERMERYQQVFSIMPGETIDGLFQGDVLPENAGDAIFDCWKEFTPMIDSLDDLGGFQYLEIRSSLPDELLMYGDKISMHHGLEIRVPYLDHDIIEYAERLNASLKVRKTTRKWLHTKVCQQYLPSEIINRKKRGFAVNVVDDWFRDSMSGKMGDMIMSGDSKMYEMLDPKAVRQLAEDHQSGKGDNHKILYSLVAFEEWLRYQ